MMKSQDEKLSLLQRANDSKWGILLSPLYILVVPVALLAFYAIAILTNFFLMLAGVWVLSGLIGLLPYALLVVIGVEKEKRLKFFLIVVAASFVVLTIVSLALLHQHGGFLNNPMDIMNQSRMELEGP